MRATVLVAALVAAACGGSSSYDDDGGGGAACTAETATATTSVRLLRSSFSPSCIIVAPSATVTFSNVDSTPHTVTTDAGQPETFDSGSIAAGASFEHTFGSSPRTVNVHCELHPMQATIIVQ